MPTSGIGLIKMPDTEQKNWEGRAILLVKEVYSSMYLGPGLMLHSGILLRRQDLVSLSGLTFLQWESRGRQTPRAVVTCFISSSRRCTWTFIHSFTNAYVPSTRMWTLSLNQPLDVDFLLDSSQQLYELKRFFLDHFHKWRFWSLERWSNLPENCTNDHS